MSFGLLRRFRSFQRGTVGPCRLTGSKVISCQSCRFEQNSANRPTRGYPHSKQLRGRLFFRLPTLTAYNFAANFPRKYKIRLISRYALFTLISLYFLSFSVFQIFLRYSSKAHSLRRESLHSLSSLSPYPRDRCFNH